MRAWVGYRRTATVLVLAVACVIAGCGAGAPGRLASSAQTTTSAFAADMLKISEAMKALGVQATKAAHELTSPAHIVHLRVPDRAGTRAFHGYGTLSLGTIVVTKPSTVYWTTNGYDFSMGDAEYSLIIYADASAGKSSIDVGTHRHVEVSSLGHWTVKIVPGA